MPSRRQLLKASAAALAVAGLGPHLALAQSAPQAGTDYIPLVVAQPTDHPGKIEVIEFFGYWCPHCNEFEPILEKWEAVQKPDVAMDFIPVSFTDAQVPFARLYYTLKALGREHELRMAVFNAIHAQHINLATADTQADWAAQHGIDRKKYLDIYNSFSTESLVRHAANQLRVYGVDSVPTLIVQGKYTVLGGERTLGTVDYLIERERKGGK